MIVINYTLSSYKDYLQQLADVFKSTIIDNKLVIAPEFGQGYFQLIELGNGLEAVIYDLKLKDTLVLHREGYHHEFYTLVFDEVENPSALKIAIGTDEMRNDAERPHVLYLTSFLYDVETVLEKNAHGRGLRVMMPTSWMEKYLQLSEKETVLEKYIQLKTAGIWYKPVGQELRQLLHDILDTKNTPLLFSQNKILSIIERFFEWLYDEMKVMVEKSGISRHDIEIAHKVESILTSDITKLPPTIKQLAKQVAMSESKLKKIFKSVYSLPLYEYFQQQRMQKARLMLLSGKYSIKDVGYTLGYSNLSNFTLAFKKVFGILPSHVLRTNSVK
jgi:AraC-like DNA-binding protein